MSIQRKNNSIMGEKNNLDETTKLSVIYYISYELKKIIDENKGGFSNGEYKIRSEYDGFTYLNDLDELSFLIHKIMYHDGGRMRPYEEFLSSKHIDEIEEEPDVIWDPIFREMSIEECSPIDDFLMDIYYECKHNVYETLKRENIKKNIEVISLKEDFKDFLEPNKYYEQYY